MNERRHALDKKKRMNATTVVATLHYDYLGTVPPKRSVRILQCLRKLVFSRAPLE